MAWVAAMAANADAAGTSRIAAVRSIQFEKRPLGVEMVMVLRMAQASDVPPAGSEVSGLLQFQSGIVGASGEKPAASSGSPAWRELGKFRARRSSAPDATPTEVAVRIVAGLRQSDRLLQLMAAATEAYAPYSRLRMQLEGEVQPTRRAFGFRRADPSTPARLGRWSASFVASPPKDPANEIFKSPDLLGAVGGAVDATTAPVIPPTNKQR